MNFIFDILVYGSITLFLYWCYGIYKQNKLLKNIPGPPPIPFIGLKLPLNIYDIKTFFDDLLSKYGKTVKYYIGSSLTVATCDIDLVQAILQSNVHIRKSPLYDLARPWLRDGLIVSYGKKWSNRRKLTNKAFHVNTLKEFFKIFNESSPPLIKRLQEEADKGNTIEANDFLAKFTFKVVAHTSFGVKMDLEKAEYRSYIDAVNFMVKLVHEKNFSLWKRNDLLFKLFSADYKKQENVLKILVSTGMKIIKKKRENYKVFKNYEEEDEVTRSKKNAILLDVLMEHPEMSNEDILEEINNFLFAGYETTSTSAAAVMYELAEHPDIQEKLYQEINFYIKNDLNNLTCDVLQKMSYLDKVFKETMRILSPLGVIERIITEESKIGDTVYPKGTVFTLLLYWIHNNPDYYPNPEKFDPERFSPENQAKRHPFSYLPFSAGPRNCIGQKYAILEVKTILVRILMEFEIFPVEDHKLVLGVSGLVKPKGGYPVKVQRRT